MTDKRGDDAAARAQAAGARADELAERLRRLRAGEHTTAEDVRQAERAAADERGRSIEAHRRAGEAHLRAARGHRQAADVLELSGQVAQAAEHRRRAQLDEDAAVVDNDRSLDRAD